MVVAVDAPLLKIPTGIYCFPRVIKGLYGRKMAITDQLRLVAMMYVRLPFSSRNVGNLLSERGIDIYHKTVRLWWNRLGPMFDAKEWE